MGIIEAMLGEPLSRLWRQLPYKGEPLCGACQFVARLSRVRLICKGILTLPPSTKRLPDEVGVSRLARDNACFGRA